LVAFCTNILPLLQWRIEVTHVPVW
jgi:hypothetical protein